VQAIYTYKCRSRFTNHLTGNQRNGHECCGLNDGNGCAFVGDEVDLDEVTITGGTIIPTTSQACLPSTDRVIMLIQDETELFQRLQRQDSSYVTCNYAYEIAVCSIFSWRRHGRVEQDRMHKHPCFALDVKAKL
jgi:hypothetical protein